MNAIAGATTRPSRTRAAAVLTAGSMAAVALAGCPSTTPSLPYTPYTGIDIESADVARNVGCGTTGTEIYEYAVVLGDPTDAGAPSLAALPDAAVGGWAGLFGCWDNAVFSSILTSPSGGPVVEAWIYAYDEADFQAAQSSVPGFAACTGAASCPLSVADAQAVVRSHSTYTTTCTATPESGDNVVASCLPIAARGAADAASATPGNDAAPDATTADGAAEAAANPTADATAPADAAPEADTGPTEPTGGESGAPADAATGATDAGATDGGAADAPAGDDDAGAEAGD